MKAAQKLILPLLLLAVVLIIYFTYFGGTETLGNFSSFDPNNNANKEIRVSIIQDKGTNIDESAGTVMFFGRDREGVEYPVQAPLPLPADFSTLESVVLKGHLHKDHFHAIEFVP